MLQRIALTAGLVVLAGGCPRPSTAAATAPVVEIPGGRAALYLYGETIESYAPADVGAYVLDVEAGPAGLGARAAAGARGAADVVGEGAYVVRLAGDERARLAAQAGVRSLRPLQPEDRRAASLAGRVAAAGAAMLDVRIDLFAGATAGEVDAVAGWLASQGGRVTWRGPASLTASAPAKAIALVPRLSLVRWVE